MHTPEKTVQQCGNTSNFKTFDTNVCLERNKSEAFFISPENKAFLRDNFSVSVNYCKAISQFTPFFIATSLPKTIQTNIAQQNQVLQPPI